MSDEFPGAPIGAERAYLLAQTGRLNLGLADWKALRVSGPDARDWLQGQITQDISSHLVRRMVRSALLTPTGQMIADLVVADSEDGFWMAVEAPVASAAYSRLVQFLVAEDVEVSEPTDACEIIWSPGPSATTGFAGEGESISFVPPDEFGAGVQHDSQLTNLFTLERGWPLFEKDYTPKTLASELGDRFVRSRISFKKGCYVGQEVVHRIYARGHTNKTWITLKTPALLKPGAELLSAAGDKAGFVTRSATSPLHGPICGAWLTNDFLNPGQELVSGPLSFPIQALD